MRRLARTAALAASDACKEDEFLYGRAGTLFVYLFFNRHVGDNPIHTHQIDALARAIIVSGRRQALAKPDLHGTPPLWWEWHGSPYLGAAHGSMVILYVLLNLPPQVLDGIPHAREWVYSAVDYLLTLECDAAGQFADLLQPERAFFPFFALT